MNKWTIIFLSATTASIIGCGWGWNVENTVKNKAPFFNNGTPSAISMEENTTRHNIFAICTDPESWVIKYNIDSNNTDLAASISDDGNITLSHNKDLPEWVNLPVWVNVSCSDGENNSTHEIIVTVQDITNDKLMTLINNAPTEISYKWNLTGSYKLEDGDIPKYWNLETSYNMMLKDDQNNTVVDFTATDPNPSDNNFTYQYSEDLSNYNLPEWNYTIVSEPITPVIWWNRNPQWDMVISSDIELKNNEPVIHQTIFDWETWPKSKTFPNVVSDDGGLANITITSSTLSQWDIVYNWDWSITYTRTDWNSWTTDTWNVTFSDWKKSTTVSMEFIDFDDE